MIERCGVCDKPVDTMDAIGVTFDAESKTHCHRGCLARYNATLCTRDAELFLFAGEETFGRAVALARMMEARGEHLVFKWHRDSGNIIDGLVLCAERRQEMAVVA